MSVWAEVFLGVIALATLTMAAIQVGVLVYGWTVARRVERLIGEVEREMKPLADNLNAVARDAARISSLTAGQVERVDRLVSDLTQRLDEATTAVQDAVVRPLREGAALMAGVRAALEIFRVLTRRAAGKRGRPDEDDPLFIG